MTLAQYLMLAAAVASALAWRWNATSAALAASYFVAQLAYLASEQPMGSVACLFIDTAVIAVIYMKQPANDCLPYRSFIHQFACFWLEKSIWDRIVVACFPLMWGVYVFVDDPWLLWWSLYWLAIAQFVAAGMDAIGSYRRARALAGEHQAPDAPSSGAQFAWVGGMRGHG